MGNVKQPNCCGPVIVFLNNLEPEIYKNAGYLLGLYRTSPLELVERISPLRGAFGDIAPVISTVSQRKPSAVWQRHGTVNIPARFCCTEPHC